MPADPTQEARESLLQKLKSNPLTTKDDAEIAKALAETIAQLNEAEKTKEQHDLTKHPDEIKRRKFEHRMNKLGVGTTLTGLAGTLFFLLDGQLKNQKLKEETALVTAQKIQIETIKARETEAERKEAVAKQQESLSKQKVEIATLLEKRALEIKETAERETQKARDEANDALEKKAQSERDVGDAEKRLAEIRKEEEAGRESRAKRNAELEALPLDKKVELADLLGAEHPIVLASGYKVGRSPATSDEEPEIARLAPRVNDLFSDDGTKRGIAYDVLTNGKDRTNPALVTTLLRTAQIKLDEYNGLNKTNPSQSEKSKAILLRRGLENVVVTLRDMSRTVTKLKPENKSKIKVLADSLIPLGYGVKEEAEKLQKWLENANQT